MEISLAVGCPSLSLFPHIRNSILPTTLSSKTLSSSTHINVFLSYSNVNRPSTLFVQNSVITYARRRKRRLVSQKSSNFLMKSLPLLVSKFNILPQPLNGVFRELGGGNAGGGSGFWRRFGGGGGFGGWRRKLGLFGFVMVCVLIFLILGEEVESDLIWGLLGIIAHLEVSVQFCKRGFRYSVLAIAFLIGLLGLGFRRDKVKKWIVKTKVICSPLMNTINRRIKRCTRAM